MKDEVWVDVGLLLARVGFGGTLIVKRGLTKIPLLLTGPGRYSFDHRRRMRVQQPSTDS